MLVGIGEKRRIARQVVRVAGEDDAPGDFAIGEQVWVAEIESRLVAAHGFAGSEDGIAFGSEVLHALA